jgi:hypothetical protein
MIEIKDSLADVLDIEPMKPVSSQPVQIIQQSSEDDVKNDYEYARSNLYTLLEKGNDAINGILAVAMESHHPRAFEVAATLIKNLGDVNDKLMNLQKMKQDLESSQSPKDQDSPSVHVDNAIFVGSTSDLLKKIKNVGTEV